MRSNPQFPSIFDFDVQLPEFRFFPTCGSRPTLDWWNITARQHPRLPIMQRKLTLFLFVREDRTDDIQKKQNQSPLPVLVYRCKRDISSFSFHLRFTITMASHNFSPIGQSQFQSHRVMKKVLRRTLFPKFSCRLNSYTVCRLHRNDYVRPQKPIPNPKPNSVLLASRPIQHRLWLPSLMVTIAWD